MITITTPAKIIIHGEHSVVYGKPALLAAIDKKITITLKTITTDNKPPSSTTTPSLFQIQLTAKSDIPIGIGLGSSAALSVSTSAVLNKAFNLNLSKSQINDIAYLLEKNYHQDPSGADNTTSTYGGFLWYQKIADYLKLFKTIDPKSLKLIPQFVIINTGTPAESTAQMVFSVKKLKNNRPKYTQKILNDQEIQTKKCLHALKIGNPNLLSQSIYLGQKNLEKLGVVSDKTKMLVKAIELLGGAAKISGAGGKKTNSGILLAYHKNPDLIYDFVKTQKLKTIKTTLATPGLTIKGEL